MQNNKEAASSYVAHGFKLCAVRGKKPFQDKWEQNPVTDLNLFDHNGIGLIHGLSGTCTLDIDNIEHTQIALEAVGLNLAALMRDGVRIESGRLNRSKLIYKAPGGIEFKMYYRHLFIPILAVLMFGQETGQTCLSCRLSF